MVREEDLQINPSVYHWTGRTMGLLERLLKVRIRLHHEAGQIEAGDIFLFNHFARFETFIPQYLIYKHTGVMSRSVAAAEFFVNEDALARYLRSLGAVPTTLPSIFPFLAKEILRGRKVVMFPEGGMVKDRRVLDRAGHYSIYSRTSMERRKQHTGAAVLALAVEAAKRGVLDAEKRKDRRRLEAWAEELGLDGVETLLAVAKRPTTIVPANITFYPIRVSENLLQRGAELFVKGMQPRLSEELQIEGNILLSNTDMDIRLQDPVYPARYLSRWKKYRLDRMARVAESLEELLTAGQEGSVPPRRWWSRWVRTASLHVRDGYMISMYAGLTVNLSHLAALCIFHLVEEGHSEIETARFERMLYLAVKRLQGVEGVHQHESLLNPESYSGLLSGDCAGLCQFLDTAAQLDLLGRESERLRFLPELSREQSFDEVRIENPVAVYANEAAPVRAAPDAVRWAVKQEPVTSLAALATWGFDDLVREYRWDLNQFSQERHRKINEEETATASGEPRLWMPGNGKPLHCGILAVHGFTASPAEVEPLAQNLSSRGFAVLAVRLKGHGTSPWDLLERSWSDWLQSVRRGYEVLRDLVGQVALVGFSGGGALGLCLAAEQPEELSGVVSVATPVRVRDKALRFVPLVHGANVVVDTVAAGKGVKLFHVTEPEHPHINYRRMPIRALYEFGQLMEALRDALPKVRCPVQVIQGREDPTVEPSSAETIIDLLGSSRKELIWVPTDRHGLVYENIGNIHADILRFLESIGSKPARQT